MSATSVLGSQPFRSATSPGAIDSLQEFTQGMDFEAFRADSKTIAAVERKLLVISEAAVRLGDQAEALCPTVPWRDIRGIGNWLRHQYDHVDLETLWNTRGSLAGTDILYIT